jgi:hypothetical protein
MQNGTRKMMDSRYTSIYSKKSSHTLDRPQLSAETCRQAPSDRKANTGKPTSNAGKGKL